MEPIDHVNLDEFLRYLYGARDMAGKLRKSKNKKLRELGYNMKPQILEIIDEAEGWTNDGE